MNSATVGRGASFELRDPRLDRLASIAAVAAERHRRDSTLARLFVNPRRWDAKQICDISGGEKRRSHLNLWTTSPPGGALASRTRTAPLIRAHRVGNRRDVCAAAACASDRDFASHRSLTVALVFDACSFDMAGSLLLAHAHKPGLGFIRSRFSVSAPRSASSFRPLTGSWLLGHLCFFVSVFINFLA
jgi:hypothetical protein